MAFRLKLIHFRQTNQLGQLIRTSCHIRTRTTTLLDLDLQALTRELVWELVHLLSLGTRMAWTWVKKSELLPTSLKTTKMISLRDCSISVSAKLSKRLRSKPRLITRTTLLEVLQFPSSNLPSLDQKSQLIRLPQTHFPHPRRHLTRNQSLLNRRVICLDQSLLLPATPPLMP